MECGTQDRFSVTPPAHIVVGSFMLLPHILQFLGERDKRLAVRVDHNWQDMIVYGEKSLYVKLQEHFQPVDLNSILYFIGNEPEHAETYLRNCSGFLSQWVYTCLRVDDAVLQGALFQGALFILGAIAGFGMIRTSEMHTLIDDHSSLSYFMRGLGYTGCLGDTEINNWDYVIGACLMHRSEEVIAFLNRHTSDPPSAYNLHQMMQWACHGHSLEILQEIQRHIRSDNSSCFIALGYESVEMMRLCGPPFRALNEIMERAAAINNSEIVDLCHDEWGAVSVDRSLRSAAMSGHLELVKKFVSWGATSFDLAMQVASRNGHCEVMRYLQPYVANSPVTCDDAFCEASANGQLEAVQLLYTAFSVTNPTRAILLACQHRYIEVVRYILSLNPEGIQSELTCNRILCAAATEGNYDIVRLVYVKLRQWITCVSEAIKKALEGEHEEVVTFLRAQLAGRSYADACYM